VPPQQVVLNEQELPHLPQGERSVRTSRQNPPQHVDRGDEHDQPQAPQFFGSVFVLTHTPLHALVVGGGHTQMPFWHVAPVAQARPHVPQFFRSVERFVHVPLQSVNPPGQ